LHFSLFFSIHETHVHMKGHVGSHCSSFVGGIALIILLSATISFQFFSTALQFRDHIRYRGSALDEGGGWGVIQRQNTMD